MRMSDNSFRRSLAAASVMVLALTGLWAPGAIADLCDPPQVNLRGQVVDRETGNPVAEALVVAFLEEPDADQLGMPWPEYRQRLGDLPDQYLDEDRLVTFADTTGHFEFRCLPAGEVRLSFPNVGFAPYTTTEIIRDGELVEGIFRLDPSLFGASEMTVFGRGPEKEVTRQSLSVFEVERIPGFSGDAIKSLQAMPGVARPTMSDPGAIVVRGSGNYDTRFILDGTDVPLLFHFGGVKSTYNTLSLGSVDLYPGGFGTSYGGSVGGIVQLKGRPARLDKWHTVLDASLLDASFHTEGPLGTFMDRDLAITLGARRSFIGEIASAAFKDNDDINFAVAPYYWDTQARLDWGQNTAHHLFLTFFAASDKIKMIASDSASGSPEVSEATDEVAFDITFRRFILGYDADLSDRVHNSLRLGNGYDKNSGHVLGEFRFEGKGPVYNLRNDLAVTWGPDVTTHLGADLIYTPFDYAVKVLGYPESKLEDKKYSDLGAYFNVDWQLTPELRVTPGIRYDYYQHLEKDEVSLRASARWDYRIGRAVTASAGTYNQPPQPIGQSTDPVYGNPDLPPTTARHLTLGHEWLLSDKLSLKVEGYHNTQDQVPAFADTNDINFLPDAQARMYGLEFMLRHQSDGGFFGWVSYSVGRSQRRFARDPGDGGSWDSDQWVLHDMDQTHHLEAVGSWELGKNWSFGSRVQFVSGVPTTPIMGYTGHEYEFDADTGYYVPVEGEYYSERVEPYFRTDLRIDKRFVKDSSVWTLYLDLQNANYFIYNSPEGYTYNYDYSKRTEYGWIFMPALGARVEF